MAIVSHNNVQSAPPSETALATAASSSESSVLTSGSNPPQPSLLPDDTKHCIRIEIVVLGAAEVDVKLLLKSLQSPVPTHN
ncbi:hypothetical protein RhiXN_06025 [Rhizoctonia solani]|uniref:Uncharacterized protein n=1 Tax=Rhizoctonia solani TaxID=456999 RepID=A0A8H8NZ91_9AGAM|nr:uncharacterized protein RhiXN_06025 [Rhizoctonia solani]QRW21036.1 hypothetical protein RhiXN_06025 [Rhizoctonia solani]